MIGRNYFRFSEITDSSKSEVSDNRKHFDSTMVIPGHRRFWEITGNHDSRLLIGPIGSQILDQSEATEWIVLKMMKR